MKQGFDFAANVLEFLAGVMGVVLIVAAAIGALAFITFLIFDLPEIIANKKDTEG